VLHGHSISHSAKLSTQFYRESISMEKNLSSKDIPRRGSIASLLLSVIP
jgi:hypothetical protein